MDCLLRRYRIEFVGTPRGSIGFHREHIAMEVEAVDEDAARLAAYETHEHVHPFRAILLSAPTAPPEVGS